MRRPSVPPAPAAPDSTCLAEPTVADAAGRESAAHAEHNQPGRGPATDHGRPETGGGA